MANASVLSDNDIRRVFRIIETTRHADRNRLAFVLSIYAGMRVGEIAALTVGDVINQHGFGPKSNSAFTRRRRRDPFLPAT
jgi:integrase/recombinase XerD